MEIAYPRTLWLLLALIPLLAMRWIEYQRTRRDLVTLSGARSDEIETLILVKWFFSTLFLIPAFALGVFAVSGVSWGEQPVEEDRQGLDVVLLVDVSRSMLADDVSPSRIALGIRLMSGALRELPTSRFALVVFKGDAQTVVPMTEDRGRVELFLPRLGSGMLTAPGTDIAEGLRTAIDAVPASSSRHRAVIIFSDGEALSGDLTTVLVDIAREGIPVSSVMLGTEVGSPIDLPSGATVTDRGGDVVVTRADPATLRRIADSSGGVFIDGRDPNALNTILDHLEGFSSRRTDDGFRPSRVDRFRLFIALSLVMFMAHVAVRTLKWKDLL